MPDTKVETETARSELAPPPTPMFLTWIYAILPSLGALLWLLAGDGNQLRTSGNPIDFVPVFLFLLIFTALRTGVFPTKVSCTAFPIG